MTLYFADQETDDKTESDLARASKITSYLRILPEFSSELIPFFDFEMPWKLIMKLRSLAPDANILITYFFNTWKSFKTYFGKTYPEPYKQMD